MFAQELCDIVWILQAQAHLSFIVWRHFFQHAPQWPCAVQKWLRETTANEADQNWVARYCSQSLGEWPLKPTSSLSVDINIIYMLVLVGTRPTSVKVTDYKVLCIFLYNNFTDNNTVGAQTDWTDLLTDGQTGR